MLTASPSSANSACPICGGADSVPIDRRDKVPILINRLYPSREAALSARAARLDFWACDGCGFGWNRAFDADCIVYDGDYENDQTHSPAFVAHVRARARDVIAAVAPDERVDYLEIGCGQGVFIGEVARATGDRLSSATGFDPAWRGEDGRGPNGARIHKAYFDAATASLLDRAPNVIASRHTIEHVPDPLSFLRSLREAIGPRSRARLFIETPCLDWIVEHEAMQDFFYEHCSIFTAGALGHALRVTGFEVRTIRHVFGGQYLWAEAQAAEPAAPKPPRGAPARRLAADAQDRFAERWRAQVRAARSQGPSAIWGAGAKGVTFVMLADPQGEMIDHAIDINPEKQGRFMPMVGTKILAPRQSAQHEPRTIFVMNPNYLDEIRQIAAAARIRAQFIPVE